MTYVIFFSTSTLYTIYITVSYCVTNFLIDLKKEVHMAKSLAYFTGLILSIMVTFNGLLSGATNTYFSNIVYHGIGLIFFGIIVFAIRDKLTHVKLKPIHFIPGILGSLTIILNNVVIGAIGVTLMIAFTLVGQVLTSLAIDHWGLLGKSITKPTQKQWVGVGIMIVGLTIMVL